MYVIGLEIIDQDTVFQFQCTVAFEKDGSFGKARQGDAGFDGLVGGVEGENVCDTAVFACQDAEGVVLEGVLRRA